MAERGRVVEGEKSERKGKSGRRGKEEEEGI
jgi:hypothetical protein